MRSIEQASTDSPSARSARKGRPPETSSDDSCKNKKRYTGSPDYLKKYKKINKLYRERCWRHLNCYLSSDSAGEPPHGFIRGIMFTSTSHLKRKCHCVSFNLKQNTEQNVALQTIYEHLSMNNSYLLLLPSQGLWAILSPGHCDCHNPECFLHTLLLYDYWCWDRHR